MPAENEFFTPFDESVAGFDLPKKFTNPFNNKPHPICLMAIKSVQNHLISQSKWRHNFGLIAGAEGPIIGKMFGVLVVRNAQYELGYLAAFSGKLAGTYHHAKFVPPVFDGLQEGGFLNLGMKELSRINLEIKTLIKENSKESVEKCESLKQLRKENSIALQQKLFEHYQFLNSVGEEKSLLDIFRKPLYNKPASGSGECTAPKLLQYAFQHKMNPIAIAEFWWGQSPKSDFWKHGQFYAACKEKCAPILSHMLQHVEMEDGDPIYLKTRG